MEDIKKVVMWGLIFVLTISIGVIIGGISNPAEKYVAKTECLEIIESTSAFSFGYGYGYGMVLPGLEIDELSNEVVPQMFNDNVYQSYLKNLTDK